MFKVGDIVKYAPKYCAPGEEYYIHRVEEVNEDNGRCLISTINSPISLGWTERVDEEMIVPASKYEMIIGRDSSLNHKYLITDTEAKLFFIGYDFMGTAEWGNIKFDHGMALEEAKAVLADLIAAE